VSDEKDAGGYEVGYGKPPKNTRFQKGSSGNPKGRPKGTPNVATVLARTLREKVVVNENGQRKKITKMQAVVKQLVNQAVSGNSAAQRQLIPLLASAEQRSSEAQAEPPSLDEADQKVMAQILERLGKSRKED
jgi:uncharacterized protein DUF5681